MKDKTLESLVPPLDLCKQIPEGAFVDSALVYIAGGIVVPRYIKLGDTEHFNNGTPAPTLAEIMKDIEILIMDNFFITGCWSITSQKGEKYFGKQDKRPEVAALLLWFDVKGRG